MSGVDGAVKLNSFRAPSTKNPETKAVVSEFVVQEEVVEENEEKAIEESVAEPIEIEGQVKEQVEDIVDEIATQETVTKFEQPPVQNVKPQKKNKVDIKTLFLSVENIVKKLYSEVFSKTPNFKPSFEITMGDLILYISKKLSLKNAESAFNAVFGLTQKVIADKYSSGYIPYVLKLSKWCEDNKKLNVTEELMFAISTVYLESAKLAGVIITELELANDFESEISYVL